MKMQMPQVLLIVTMLAWPVALMKRLKKLKTQLWRVRKSRNKLRSCRSCTKYLKIEERANGIVNTVEPRSSPRKWQEAVKANLGKD